MAYNLKDVKILLVEDNVQMLQLLKTVLQSFGIGTVVTALNGEEGFEQFCLTNPDVVITDWLMTPCDGISLTQKIRNEVRSPNQFVPVILMTGFSQERRVINARDIGITEFLVKPFNARDLYKRLFQIIEKPRQFVRCEDFFGPDRRRRSDDDFGRRKKRGNDETSDDGEESAPNKPVKDVDFR